VLPLGILFHVGIAVLQGLVSFSLIMIGALVLYLRPLDQPFSWKGILAGPRQRADGDVDEIAFQSGDRFATAPESRA
jgi:hypothetical protein